MPAAGVGGSDKRAADLPTMTVVEHLVELRRRLVIVLFSVVAGAVFGWYGQEWLIALFSKQVGRLVFFTPAEMFVTKLRMAATIGVFISLPVALAQAWLFVMPGLYPEERNVVRRCVPIAGCLFVLGTLLGYLAVYPFLLRVLLGMAGLEAAPAVSIADHFSLFLAAVVPFGLMFQVPVAIVVLVRLGLIDPLLLKRRRRHVVFWSFVVAAVISPPDVASQAALALPMILVFELGIRWARRILRRQQRE